jgi:hypothetical protein
VHLCGAGNIDAQLAHESIVEAIDPAVNAQRLPALPRCLHQRGLRGVDRLVDDVQFAETVDPLRAVGETFQVRPMPGDDVLDVPQPVVDQAQLLVGERTPPQP